MEFYFHKLYHLRLLHLIFLIANAVEYPSILLLRYISIFEMIFQVGSTLKARPLVNSLDTELQQACLSHLWKFNRPLF